jgi:DNA polymerase-1
MRKRFIYDIETDGLLEEVTRVHSLVMWDLDTQELLSFRNDGHPDNLARLEEAIELLNNATFRAGHNVINYDEQVLHKLYPSFRPNIHRVVFDTIIATRLIYPNIFDSDKHRVLKGTLPRYAMGSHSLEAWGCRLGEWKGDYAKVKEAKFREEFIAAWGEDVEITKEAVIAAVWGSWNQEMQDYCGQDVRVNAKLFGKINARGYDKIALWDEMDIAYLCAKIERNGFPFNGPAAERLQGELMAFRADTDFKLREFFGSWVEKDGAVKTPKTPNSAHGYWGDRRVEDCMGVAVEDPEQYLTPKGTLKASAKAFGLKLGFEGYPYQPIRIVSFNPTSRFHIANRLKALYGWEPEEFTESGEPKVDETVLAGLTFAPIKLLINYFLVSKRLGQLAEGKQAWLLVQRDGGVHGRYNTVGAITRRATHSSPNIGQVPGVKKNKAGEILLGIVGGWGAECRQLFGVPKGWTQVGTDASGLELRCLAHYMSRWDAGEYGRVLLEGDIHTVNQLAAGLDTRDNAKTFIYAFLYGAGDGKIGSIVGGTATEGARLREKFMAGVPALGNLVKAVKKKAKAQKELIAVDGGVLKIRSDHSALNTLLQSAGAIICKKWGVLIERELVRRGYKHGWDGDFAFMAWVHDEYQIAARTEKLAHEIGEISKWAIRQVEEHFTFQCPLDADYKIGRNWAECH